MNEAERMKDHLLDWLRDAHAMEEQAETMLSATAERLENYPALKQRIEQHIIETQGQGRRVAACIERLGGDTSAFKDAGGKLMATAQGFSGMFASDEVVKGAIFSYAFENLEIASYKSLIAAALQMGDQQTARACEDNLEEEIAMAEWLHGHIEQLTVQFLAKAQAGEPAKR
ncbi:MAG: ferritin-like domain-containing protein [Pigmentiphaga sp.]